MTIDRSHANVADSASAFKRKGCAFERSTVLLVWNRGVRSHAEVCQVSACMKDILVKHIMTYSTGSKSYTRACHEKVYIMITTIFFNIYILRFS
jgi:hypothetical protein